MACGTAASADAIRNLRCGKGMQIPALAFDQLSETAKTCRGRAYHPAWAPEKPKGNILVLSLSGWLHFMKAWQLSLSG